MSEEFKVGDRVMVRDDALPGYLVSFARFAKGRPGAVVRVADGGLPYLPSEGRALVEFALKRKRGKPRVGVVWLSDLRKLGDGE